MKRKKEYLNGDRSIKNPKKYNEYQDNGDGTTFVFSGNLRILIDSEDLSLVVDGWAKWEIKISGSNSYARRKFGFKNQMMHRYIMGLRPGDGKEIDHINHDGLDNRKSNLRVVSRQVNAKNIKKLKSNVSGVSGVSWNKARSEWRSYIKVNGKHKQVFATSDFFEAVCRRKSAEIKYDFHFNHGR